MPTHSTGKEWLSTELRNLVRTPPLLMPLGRDCFVNRDSGYIIAEDGFGIFGPDNAAEPSCACVVLVFETGEVWTIDTYDLAIRNVIPYFEADFVESFSNYTVFLRDRLGVPPPYHWIAGVEGVKDRPIEVPRQVFGNQPQLIEGARGSCLIDLIEEEGTYSDGITPAESLRPFFRKIYARCGINRPPWMDGIL